MSITFETLSANDLTVMHEVHWSLALDALETPQIEGLILPYSIYMRAYEDHMNECSACQDSPVWDISCERGAELAHQAADAMGRQDRLAELN